MVSTPTTRIRAEKQGLGENLNTWGHQKLNAALDRFDEAVAAVTTVAISSPATTLTSTNYTADQARSAVLVFTGALTAASTVTVPNVEKTYLIVNNTTGAYALTLKTAAGSGYALRGGPQSVYCDGTDVYRATPRLDQAPAPAAAVDLAGQKITGLATPTLSTDAATKAYADAAAFASIPDATATANSVAKRTAGATLAAAGLDLPAGTRTVGYTATVGHDAGNVGSVSFGISDGNTQAGVFVNNERSGSLNSQTIDLKTAEGGVSLATTRLRIERDGYIRIGQTSTNNPGVGNTTLGSCTWQSGRQFISQDSFSNWNMNADGTLVAFARSSSVVGGISINTFSAAFNTSSDYRLKENVQPLTGALDRLAQLKPSRFAFTRDPTHTIMDGFIAHEVQPVVPQAVTGSKDAVDAFGQPQYQSIDTSKVIPLLTAAIQELLARVEALEAP